MIETKYIANCIDSALAKCAENKRYQLCQDIAEAFKTAADLGLNAGHSQLMDIVLNAENGKYLEK